MPAAATLQIDLRPSLQLAAVLAVAHVLALAVAWVSLAETLHRSPTAAVSLELHSDGRASWRDRNGTWHEGRLGADHFVSTALVVMGLEQVGRGRKWVVLMADSASTEELRRLRIWLRWRRAAGSAGSVDPTPPE